jgi:hypothetical protein
MQHSRKSVLREQHLVFFLCLAAIAGPALSSLFDGSEKQFPDAATYLGIANGDFDQTPVRRYRILIPFLARALDLITAGLFENLSPTYYQGEFSLRFSFFLVNLCIMAWFCSLVYRYCTSFGFSRSGAILGTAAVVTSRYTIYFAALPLIDSLISVVTALVLLGIKTGNKKMLVFAIFLGPLARESFIFIAPLIVFFGRIPALRQVLYFTLSGMLALIVRITIDHYYPLTTISWLQADANHFLNIQENLPLLFSWYGLYKVLINMGLWLLLPLTAFFLKRDFLKGIFNGQTACLLMFLISVLIQMLLSGSMERMFYPLLMVFAVVICASINVLRPRSTIGDYV